MSIARTIQTILVNRGVSDDVLTHEPTSLALAMADACLVSRNMLAKGVLVRRKGGHLLSVSPAPRKVSNRIATGPTPYIQTKRHSGRARGGDASRRTPWPSSH